MCYLSIHLSLLVYDHFLPLERKLQGNRHLISQVQYFIPWGFRLRHGKGKIYCLINTCWMSKWLNANPFHASPWCLLKGLIIFCDNVISLFSTDYKLFWSRPIEVPFLSVWVYIWNKIFIKQCYYLPWTLIIKSQSYCIPFYLWKK